MKDIKGKIRNYVKKDFLLEFNSPEECMNYFNTYDYQNFQTVEDMKKYQGKYGFGYNGKWYHINVDEALDILDNINTAKPSSDVEAAKEQMKEALEHLRKAWLECENAFSNAYIDCNDYIMGSKETEDEYPFHASFEDINVVDWIVGTIKRLSLSPKEGFRTVKLYGGMTGEFEINQPAIPTTLDVG